MEIQDFALVLLSGEAWFQINGYENSQSNRLMLMHEVASRDMKVGVWCAVSAVSIIGLVLENINSHRYVTF
jgi:hypothetical protein